MFEDYRDDPTPACIAPLVAGYDRLRCLTTRADIAVSFALDRYRRRWRRAHRVDALDTYLGETAQALSGLEGELDTNTAATLGSSRKQVEWMLSELRRGM